MGLSLYGRGLGVGLLLNNLQRLNSPCQIARQKHIDVFTSQLATQLVSLLYTIQGQTSVRLTLHDLVYVVHGLAVTNQQQPSHYLTFERCVAAFKL